MNMNANSRGSVIPVKNDARAPAIRRDAKEIARREGRMGEIEKLLSSPGPQDDMMELTREYLELKRALDADTDEWTTLMEQLDN